MSNRKISEALLVDDLGNLEKSDHESAVCSSSKPRVDPTELVEILCSRNRLNCPSAYVNASAVGGTEISAGTYGGGLR